MGTPKISLFQDSEGLKLSNSLLHHEEEEYREEQGKRKEEIEGLLVNAFDDLCEGDDDSSVNNSFYNNSNSYYNINQIHNNDKSNFVSNNDNNLEVNETIPRPTFLTINSDLDNKSQHQNHCFQNQNTKELESYRNSDNDFERLKILNDSRLIAIEKLTKDLKLEQESNKELSYQLKLCETDKEKILTDKEEQHKLFVACKQKILDLEEDARKLEEELVENKKLLEESHNDLGICRAHINSLQQKILLYEKYDANTNREKHIDSLVETMKINHQKEIVILQEELEKAKDRIEIKKEECSALEKVIYEIEKKNAAMLLKKCDSTVRQENTIQILLDRANEEKLEMNKKILQLQGEIETLKNDVEQYEVSANINFANSSSDEIDGINPLLLDGRKRVTSTPKCNNIAKLKEELYRALAGKRHKQKELNKLQEQVQSKELQLQEMNEKERVYLRQTEDLKADMEKILQLHQKEKKINEMDKVLSKQSKLELEMSENKNTELQEKIKLFQKEIETLNNRIESSEMENQREKNNFIAFYDKEIEKIRSKACTVLKEQESNLSEKYKEIKKECDEVKQMYMNLREEKEKLIKDLESAIEKTKLIELEKEKIKSLLQLKEEYITRIQDEISITNKERFRLEEQLKQLTILPNVDKLKSTTVLENEILALRKELSELPKRHIIELESFKMEQIKSKERLTNLQKELKLEFDNKMADILKENLELKQKLDLINSECSGKISKKDIGILTDINNEINKNLINCPDIELQYKKKLEQELKDLELILMNKHRDDLNATEKRIKNLTIKYFTDEMANLQENHKSELQQLMDRERLVVMELKNSLIAKDAQIEQLKNLNSQDNLKEKLKILQNQIGEDRNRSTELIQRLTEETQSMKDKIIADDGEMKKLNFKLHQYKKRTIQYKDKLVKNKQEFKDFKNKMLVIQNKFDALKLSLNQIEKHTNDRLNELEAQYQHDE